MHLRYSILYVIFVCIFALALVPTLQAQQATPHYQQQMQEAREAELQYLKQKRRVDSLAEKYNLEVRYQEDGRTYEIMRFENNRPVYVATHNDIAQQTIAVDEVQPGGATGYNLTGAGITLGEWDAGGVRDSHQEFGDRVNQADGDTDYHSHATHVAGILMAAGVQSSAEGMSYEANLKAYNWGNAGSEMRAAAADGLVVSNHSYGTVVGWGGSRACRQGSDEQYPQWHGNPGVSQTEEYLFGFYSNGAQNWDDIAYDNPNYLIVKSAGNDRNDNGPSEANPGHCVNNGGWQYSEVERQADGGQDGFDSIGSKGNAKNILTVGAIRDIPGGYEQPSDVRPSSFTSYGPADDGRIKPDVVANGTGLYSPVAGSDNSYASYSGTSMSSPNAAGGIGLLHEMYKELNGADQVMRASTVKSLLIQTADEAGNSPGPDYRFGWGLVNIRKAADLIQLDNKLGGSVIHQLTLNENDTLRVPVEVDPDAEELNVTVGWTDPPGDSPSPSLDPPTPMLVNDLDVKLVGPDGDHFPWKMDRDNPSTAATKGENNVDNTEKVTVDSPVEGRYVVQVTHDGSLHGSSQEVSLILDRGAGATYDVSGQVTLESGGPAAGVQLNLSGFGEGTAETDSAGYYTFYGLYNGDYTVTPATEDISFSPQSQDVTVDGTDVTGVHFTASTPGYRNITLRLNTSSLPDTLQPDDTLQVRGNIEGTSDAPDQLPDGNILSWDDQSTLTLENVGGDYWQVQFQIPDMETVNFKFYSAQNRQIGVGGLETGANHQIEAGIGGEVLPLHYFEKDTETDHPYGWIPWEQREARNAVRFRLYVPEKFSPLIIGVRGDDFNNNGPLREDQSRVSLAREVSDDTKPGYRLYTGVGHFPGSLAGEVQQYKFKFEFGSLTEASWRTFAIPDRDTTLHWTLPNNALPVVNDDEVTMQEDTTLIFNPVANDFDPDGGPLRIDSIPGFQIATARVFRDSLIEFTPDTNVSGRLQFNYIVEDVEGAQVKGRITINIENVNDRPGRPIFQRPTDSTTVQVSGTWDDTFVAGWDSVFDIDGDPLRYRWELTQNTDFSDGSPLLTRSTKTDSIAIRNAALDSVLASLGVEEGQTATLQHRILVDDGTVVVIGDTMTTYFERGTITRLSDDSQEQPEQFSLHQNYPNPFNPSTMIRYKVPRKAHVELTIYNTLGQKVATLVDKTMGAGSYKVRWEAGNHNSGLYLYRLKAGDFTRTRSMILLK